MELYFYENEGKLEVKALEVEQMFTHLMDFNAACRKAGNTYAIQLVHGSLSVYEAQGRANNGKRLLAHCKALNPLITDGHYAEEENVLTLRYESMRKDYKRIMYIKVLHLGHIFQEEDLREIAAGLVERIKQR